MGYARWDASDWSDYVSRTRGRRTEELFAARGMDPALDPYGVRLRESRDSERNPASTGIIVALDVTGSMGMIADVMARQGLGTLVEELLRRRPVTDPHTMIMGVGDASCDQAPLQVTQFEADIRIAQQLQALWLEKGGGGNNFESYNLPWYFAARHTAMDCWERRGRKGYLFTVGDEEPPEGLTPAQVARVCGDRALSGLSSPALLREAQERFNVFHVVVEEGSHARAYPDRVLGRWRDALGQNVIRLADHTRLAEVIVSAIAVAEGADRHDVTGSWDGSTAAVVGRALSSGSAPGRPAAPRAGGVMRYLTGR